MTNQDDILGQPPVVIVAEDELLIRMTAAQAIAAAGLHVLEATHAEEALAILKARAREVRVLFTDIQMPGGIDGLELARLVLNQWPWIRVVIASAKDRLAPDELPPGSRFVAKPYDPNYVAAQIREIVAGK